MSSEQAYRYSAPPIEMMYQLSLAEHNALTAGTHFDGQVILLASV